MSEHRAVLFDAIGPGSHDCHWCGKSVSWDRRPLLDNAGALVVDHVDEQRDNNDLSNLVPSCVTCNLHRNPKPQPRRTHCLRGGHELTPENVYWQQGKRLCRTCANERARRKHHKRRAANAADLTARLERARPVAVRERGKCGNGHELNEKNTRYTDKRWHCRICEAERTARYKAKRRTAA